MQSTLRLMAAEARSYGRGRDGHYRLADIIVIQAIRSWIEHDPRCAHRVARCTARSADRASPRADPRGPGSPLVGCLARRRGRDVTVSLCRSLQRTRRRAPMRYVARWRMQVALTLTEGGWATLANWRSASATNRGGVQPRLQDHRITMNRWRSPAARAPAVILPLPEGAGRTLCTNRAPPGARRLPRIVTIVSAPVANSSSSSAPGHRPVLLRRSGRRIAAATRRAVGTWTAPSAAAVIPGHSSRHRRRTGSFSPSTPIRPPSTAHCLAPGPRHRRAPHPGPRQLRRSRRRCPRARGRAARRHPARSRAVVVPARSTGARLRLPSRGPARHALRSRAGRSRERPGEYPPGARAGRPDLALRRRAREPAHRAGNRPRAGASADRDDHTTGGDRGRCARRPARSDIHPATRTFQALRIATNEELAALEAALRGRSTSLRRWTPGGDRLPLAGRPDRQAFHRARERRAASARRKYPSASAVIALGCETHARAVRPDARRWTPTRAHDRRSCAWRSASQTMAWTTTGARR